ncbi:Crp/Fnr family transcriptional regulator [Schleiferiaceae bacterium]|jgi:CRP/FNR family transcriptional regulator|nr:Crp/Fnr family transcriptional regulator [Schleiferiaceae bacterium]MDA9151204.1 Crp/Fnr family transcriptional regulator [Schleiferiaceae bacterium]
MHHPTPSDIAKHFGFQDPELIEAILQHGRFCSFESGDLIAEPGMPVDFVPMIIKGNLRVMRKDEAHDRELFLYFLTAGSTCSSTINCCMTGKKVTVEVVVEEDSDLICIPNEYASKWIHRYPEWLEFVLRSYQMRFEEALHALDEVAFRQLDERLWNFLVEKSRLNETNTIEMSHSDLAQALHSSREVVSRLLKKLESEDRLELGRNRILILR